MPGAQVDVIEAEGSEAARYFALDHDVRRPDEPAEIVAPTRRVEVDHDAALRRVVVPPPEAAVGVWFVGDEGPEGARRVATRRLDEHDVGPEVTQQLSGPRTPEARDFDDPHPVERAGHSTPASSSATNSSSVTPRSPQNTSRLCSPSSGAPR